MTEYLSEDRYGKWLKVEGNGEEAKFWCWVCHQYTGAKDLLGTSKTLPASEEKLSIHDKHTEHINALKRHLASLSPKGTIQQALKVIPVAEEDMNTLRCISWLIDHKMSAQQHTKDLVALLRQLGVATRDKARNNHLSKKSVKQMVHEGVRHLAFMIDLHEELQAVSICFQADSVTVADVAQRVGFAINAIKKRATICGDIESAVHRYITTGKGPWEQGSLQIVRCSAEELSEHNQDREGICDDLAGSFNIRYLTALSDPIVKALRVLDTSRWPVYKQQDTAELDAYGNDAISELLDNYRVFFEDTTGAKVLAQWERMKQTIASDPQLSRMEFNVLWPRMLSRSGFVKQFSLVLRIVGIAVTFTVDTSGCERLISLMNDLKTKFQERMGHEYLRDLVWWHKSKRLLSHAEWEAALGRTLVRWSQAGHRRHQAHTQLSADTIQLVSARDDGPDDDGETVPADSYQDLCKLAEL